MVNGSEMVANAPYIVTVSVSTASNDVGGVVCLIKHLFGLVVFVLEDAYPSNKAIAW